MCHGSSQEEADRIANEIQRKRDKESRELEEDRLKKMVIMFCSCWSYILGS